MEYIQLRYFLTVAEHENITHAANELNISQPSLSKTISRLEENLGVELFERKGKRILLNEFGRMFEKRVRRIFVEMDQAQRELTDMAKLRRNRITIGSTVARIMPKLLTGFLGVHPNILFNLIQITSHEKILKSLLDGEIDLSVSILPIDEAGVECHRQASDEILIAVSKNHRLAGQGSVSLIEIANEPLVYHSNETGLRRITDSFLKRMKINPKIAFECTTPDIICELAGKGFGNTLIPASWLDTVDVSSLSCLHINDFKCERGIWLSWVTDRYMPPSADDFITHAKVYFSKGYSLK
ncbi:MAG: LysR family transcriptional regulator [Deferribacterales bacterium]